MTKHSSALVDSYLADEQIGRLLRMRISTWNDLANLTFNEIVEIPHFQRRNLTMIKMELEARKLPIREFDALALLSSATRSLLEKHGISSLGELCAHSRNELLELDAFGSTRLSDCEDIVSLSGWMLRPDDPEVMSEPLRAVAELLNAGMDWRQISDVLGIHISTVRNRLQKIRRLEHHNRWLGEQRGAWEKQQAKDR